MSGRSELEADGVAVRGQLTLSEFAVTADDLDVNGVLTISPTLEGVTMIVDAGLSISGIRVMGDDGTTDITADCGGMTMFVATDSEPYPSSFTVTHDDGAVTAEHRFDCPSASGGPRGNVTVGRLQTSIRYSGTLQRWICPGWSA